MSELISYLDQMATSGASDIYLIAGAPPQMKVDGVSSAMDEAPLEPNTIRELSYGIMSDRQQAEFESEQELNFAVSVKGVGRFRVNMYIQRGHPAMVVRYLKSVIPSIETLGLPASLKDLVKEPRGLFLVVGSTGSGKSTTLASMIDHRSRTMTGHILTIEDPIEYIHEHHMAVVSQREVGLDTRSYANALKNAVREAPDVIMIGEIRDADTMHQAIAYADTGHLCLSTLHANNAYQALERAVNFFPESIRSQVLDDLAMNLRGIFSQRLMRTRDGGRAPACELLLTSPYVVDLIQKGDLESIRDHMEHSHDSGMLTFEQSVFEAYMAGRVDMDEALRSVDSRGNLQTRIRLANSGSALSDKEFSIDFE